MNITQYIFEGHEVRTLVIDNDPWFVGKDVALVLGYKNHADALSRHVDDEDKDGVVIPDPIGRNQKPTIINESGLYSLILRSKLESAKKFKRWVTSVVLPSVRKTGSYSVNVPTTFAAALRLAADQAEENEKLARQLEAAKPAVDFVKRSVEAEGLTKLGEVAKTLSLTLPFHTKPMGRNLLFAELRSMGILMKQGKFNIPLQIHVNSGRFEVKQEIIQRYGKDFQVPVTMVTGKGMQWIRRKLLENGCREG